jgi:hypothetical protein
MKEAVQKPAIAECMTPADAASLASILIRLGF